MATAEATEGHAPPIRADRMETRRPRLASTLQHIGRLVVRYGLALVIAWMGAMKLTAYGAQTLEGLVTNSPLLAWAHGLLELRALAAVLGAIELVIAFLIAVKPLAPRLSAAGSVGAVIMFLVTLSFLGTTPGAFEAAAGGFPALSADVGQFLIKDVVLLGAAVWLMAESIYAARAARRKAVVEALSSPEAQAMMQRSSQREPAERTAESPQAGESSV